MASHDNSMIYNVDLLRVTNDATAKKIALNFREKLELLEERAKNGPWYSAKVMVIAINHVHFFTFILELLEEVVQE